MHAALLAKEQVGTLAAQEAVTRVLSGLMVPTYLTNTSQANELQRASHGMSAGYGSSSSSAATEQVPDSSQAAVPAWQPMLRWLGSMQCLQSQVSICSLLLSLSARGLPLPHTALNTHEQVNSRLWIRNGDDALMYESFYSVRQWMGRWMHRATAFDRHAACTSAWLDCAYACARVSGIGHVVDSQVKSIPRCAMRPHQSSVF